MRKAAIKIFWVIITLVIEASITHSQSLPFPELPYASEKSGGSIEMIFGQTNNPLYPRGAGRGQKWEGSLFVYQFDQEKPLQWWITTKLRGGAIIDNPEEFSVELGAKVRLPKHWWVTVRHLDVSALNNTIIGDLHARRTNSSVNSWWLGMEYQKRTKNTNTTIGYAHMMFGNEPLFATGFTKPYAQNLFYAYRAQQIKKWNVRINTTAEWYAGNSTTKTKLALGVEIEKPILKNEQWCIVAKGFKIINIGVPKYATRYDGAALFNLQGAQCGIRYRFH